MQIEINHPAKLYRYSRKEWLERSLLLGEFRLVPVAEYKKYEGDAGALVRAQPEPGSKAGVLKVTNGMRVQKNGEITSGPKPEPGFLTICLSDRWDESLLDKFPDADACLVIHDVEQFCQRIHFAAEAALPGWAGLDAPVIYGGRSELGAVFSKPSHFSNQHEWRFAWRPTSRHAHAKPVTIRIGSIEKIAEIIERPTHMAGNS